MRNMTPHTINFYRPSDVTFSKETKRWVRLDSAKPYAVLPSDGCARVQHGLSKPEDAFIDGMAVPVVEKPILDIDPIPDGDPVIVSLIYATAYRLLRGNDGMILYTVGDTILDENGAIIGAKNLVKV